MLQVTSPESTVLSLFIDRILIKSFTSVSRSFSIGRGAAELSIMGKTYQGSSRLWSFHMVTYSDT